MGGRRARMVGIAVAAACAVVAAVLVLVLDVGGGGGGGGGGKGGGRTANLWVSRSVGSCMRSPEPAPYDAATACSFPEALAFSEGGNPC